VSNISTAQLVSLIAASLMLMLVGRNVAALRIPVPKMAGYALIWLMLFALIVLVASHFSR